jgi:DNA-binding winged helix-turn-helix (wHTH) protein
VDVRPIAADPSWLDLARTLTGEAVAVSTLALPALKRAELVVIGGRDAWERIRAWRAAGVAIGIVVVGSPPPEDRPRLEPVVVLAGPDAGALRQARERLAETERAGTVRLAGGVADLHRGLFHRADGTEHRLTGLEARLLGYLAARGRPVGHAELQEQVWEHRKALETRAVEVAVMRLRRKLEVDPARPVSLLTVRGEGYRVVAAEAAAPDAPPTGPTPLVGRGDLLATLALELRTGITALIGPAGAGKSAVLRALAAAAPGVVAVDLDGAPADPWTALAVALGVALPPRGPAAPAVLAALDGRSALLVDHGDLHLPGLADVGRALGERGVGLVVASRRLPSWVGARVREVPPLALDDAVALLADRSGVRGPGVDEIAQRLDRLPLALELVAARLAALGPEVLLDALRTHGTLWLRGDGHRHASVRDAIAWSVARAPGATVAALARLASFAGPFGADLAAEVAAVGPLELLTLVEDGLLVREERRFRLLHAVAEYVREQRPDDLAGARTSYAAAIARRARALLAGFEGPAPRDAMDGLRALVPELRRVVDGAPPDPSAARLDAVLGLERVLAVHGTPEERAALLAAWEGVADEPGRGALALRRAALAFHGDRDAALAALDAATERVRAADPALASRMALQAVVYAFTHESPRAVLARVGAIEPHLLAGPDRARLEAVAVRCRAKVGELAVDAQVPLLEGLAATLLAEGALARAVEVGLRAGDVLLSADPVRADRVLGRAVARVDALVEPTLRCGVRVYAAQAAGECGRTDEALALLAAADAEVVVVDPVRRWLVAHTRGRVLTAAGRHEEARAAFAGCLAWWRERGWEGGAYDQLEQLAIVDLDAGDARAAAAVAAEALAVARSLGDARSESEASTWLAAAALLGGHDARDELASVRPDDLLAGPRLVYFACCARLDPADPVARAEVERARARLPAALPAVRISLRLAPP